LLTCVQFRSMSRTARSLVLLYDGLKAAGVLRWEPNSDAPLVDAARVFAREEEDRCRST
jgi:hypothetical protein